MADLTMTRGARLAAIGLLILTLVVGGANLAATYLEVRAASQQAARQYATNVSACQLGNENRSQQVALWEHIISISPASGTAAQRKAEEARVASFMGYVRHVFAPRNCASIYRPIR